MSIPTIRPPRAVALTAILWALLAFGCGGGGDGGPTGPPPDDDPFDGPATIGPAGGIMGLGEVVRVEIPPGALQADAQLVVEAVPTPPDLVEDEAIGQAYRVGPSSAALAAAVRVAISVPSEAREGRPLEAITIARADAAASDLAPAAVELEDVRRNGPGTVSGETGRLGTFSATLADNRSPTIDAGPDLSPQVGTAVTMTATVSDPDGDPVSVAWSLDAQPDDSEAEIDVDGAEATLVPDEPGSYAVVATATDGRGGSATATVAIVATSPPGAVVADAGDDQTVNVGATVTLDGTGSTGDDIAYSWEIVSAPGAVPTLTGSSTAQPSFPAQDAGDYRIELEVTDGNQTDSDEVRVTVVQPNRAPTVTLSGPTAVLLGSDAVVSATASDPDGDPLQLTFELTTPSSSSTTVVGSGSGARFTPDVPGRYGVTVRASDGSLSSQATADVYGNPEVAGTYDVTFAVHSFSSSCPDDFETGQGEAPINIEQSSSDPSRVTLLLSELDDAITSDAAGRLLGTGFTFDGSLTVVDDEGNSVTLNADFSGEITGDGVIDLDTVLGFFTCQVRGTLEGTRQ